MMEQVEGGTACRRWHPADPIEIVGSAVASPLVSHASSSLSPKRHHCDPHALLPNALSADGVAGGTAGQSALSAFETKAVLPAPSCTSPLLELRSEVPSLACSPNRSVTAASAEEEYMEDTVVHKGRLCTLTYSTSHSTLRITRVTRSGKTRTLLSIPLRLIINIESAAEKEARQLARKAIDDKVKDAFAANGAGTGNLLCTASTAASEEENIIVFARSQTHSIDTSSLSLSNGYHQSLTQSSPLRAKKSSSPISAAAENTRYYVHYVRQSHRESPTMHSFEFSAKRSGTLLPSILTAVVQRIYRRGSKHIIAFISTKSGKGKGKQIFEKQVRPFLHFSRHTFQSYVTRSAHDCENYIADLSNHMNQHTVLTAIGGDGMINEVVNGLHRRKMALIRWLRSTSAEGTTEDGLAGTLSSPLPVVKEHCCFPEAALSTSLASLEDRTSPMTRQTTAVGHKDGHPEEGCGTASRARVNVMDWRPLYPGCTAERTDGSMGDTAQQAYTIACRLVRRGWDAIMPLVATVAAGSACGLAKSLDVLSIAEAALSLVHLNTVHTDLLLMHFTPNREMMAFHLDRMRTAQVETAKRSFADYKKRHAAELQERARVKEELNFPSLTLTADDATPPFLREGSNVYRDPVSCAMCMPEFRSRVAFMSLSFGAANDIDHGSEPLRWMGNARFHVYGGYMMVCGLKKYSGVLRYLPWVSRTGKTLEKVHTSSPMPSPEDFPPCTMRSDCPHCVQYDFSHCSVASPHTAASSCVKAEGQSDSSPLAAGTAREHGNAAATLAPFSDRELLDEVVVDFDDEALPWVTIRGDFCIALLCNVRDVAQDMCMAPLAHLSDGAIDVVYCRIDPTTGRGGRLEMLKFFMGLESGSHVKLDFVNYVKARALEMKVDAGISMSDGELMPLASVRMTKMRNSVRFVRSE